METTRILLHPSFNVGAVDPRLFGGFLEHMGRAVYEGVYEPGSRHADADGCRSDVLAALRRLRMTAMRYPGGNFASGYHWRDGVGPRGERPTVRDLAWQSVEPNAFGTDEFVGALPEDGLDADAHRQPRHRHSRGGARLGRVLQLPGRDPRGGPPGGERPSRAPRGEALVPGQRDGRPVAARARARGAVRDQGAAGREDDEGLRPLHRDRGLRLVHHEPAHLDGVGPAGARARRGRGRLRQPAPLRGQPRGRHAGLPRRDRRHRPADRGGGRRVPVRAGPAEERPAGAALLRRVERVVQGEGARRARAAGAAPDRGGLQPRGRAGGRRLPQQLRPPRRRREDREPRADRERDRPAAHTRRRAAGAVDLPPLRDDESAPRRRVAAGGGRRAVVRRDGPAGGCRSSTPAPSSAKACCTCS